MKPNEKTIFLWDGCGALLSAWLLGVILPYFQPWIGMPTQHLYSLASLALCYAVYDFWCWCWANTLQPKWLYGVIVANTSHCVLNSVLLCLYTDQITTLGFVYFILEILVVMGGKDMSRI